MQNSSAHPFQHPTDTNTNTVIPLGGRQREGKGGEGQWDGWKEQRRVRQMELPLLVDFLYINGGWVPNKLAAGTCWKCALARSPCLPQPPTICYHGKLSVRAVPPLYHSAVKTPLHCKTLKTHHLSLQPSLFLSTRDSLRSYFSNLWIVRLQKQSRNNLLLSVWDRWELLVEGTIVAIVTVWLTAWRNEDRSPIVSEFGEGRAQKQKKMQLPWWQVHTNAQSTCTHTLLTITLYYITYSLWISHLTAVKVYH